MSKRHLIAIFLPALAGGGAEKCMTHLANQFVKLGRQVNMVLVRKEGPYLALLDSRVNLQVLNVGKTFKATNALHYYFSEQTPHRPALASKTIGPEKYDGRY